MIKKTNPNLFLAMTVHLLILIICTSDIFAAGTYDDGDGSAGNPFQINTPAHMDEIGLHSEDWASYFILTADINLSDYTGMAFNIIGNDANAFTGTFDGDGHTISNFTYIAADKDYVGVFGYINNGGEIKNLGIVNVNVDAGAGNHVGGLVGYVYTGGRVADCFVDGGSVMGDSYVGGLVGRSYGSVTNCYATNNVSGDRNFGGLVGQSFRTVSNCYATGNVIGGTYGGGLVGFNFGVISNCYSTGNVSGSGTIGGLVGYNYQTAILASFWDIETSGQSESVGYNELGTVEVYGRTSAQMQMQSIYTDVGWDFIGDSRPSDDWGMPDGGGYPVLWWQLGTLPDLPAFSGGSGDPNNPYIIANANDLNNIGYNSRLMSKNFMLVNNIDLSGIEFYQIGDVGYHFKGLFDGNDRTINNFTCIITSGKYTTGLFGYVGNGGEIKNLGVVDPNVNGGTADYTDYVGGIVGILDSGGTVSDCFLDGGSVSVMEADTGGLAGYNGGTVLNCYVTGSISGGYYTGGLVGYNVSNISNCYVTGSVTGTDRVGGLVGFNFNFGVISNCYATGSVTATSGNSYAGAGGLVGYNGATVVTSYAIGNVSGTINIGGLVGRDSSGSYTGCFWDSDINLGLTGVGNIADPANVMSRTTVQMQTESTFTDYGWDFWGETANGTDDIWIIFGAGPDYPKLTAIIDSDGDGVPKDDDNCPFTYNPGQEDNDDDGLGNVCDPCPDSSDNDADGDWLCDGVDNCPSTYNPGQEDDDSDGLGNVCDPCPGDPDDDADSDGICGDIDNCPDTANPVQTDSDGDGIGDECECQAANLDGINPVNFKDFAIVAQGWGDIYDMTHLAQVAQHWLSDCNPP